MSIHPGCRTITRHPRPQDFRGDGASSGRTLACSRHGRRTLRVCRGTSLTSMRPITWTAGCSGSAARSRPEVGCLALRKPGRRCARTWKWQAGRFGGTPRLEQTPAPRRVGLRDADVDRGRPSHRSARYDGSNCTRSLPRRPSVGCRHGRSRSRGRRRKRRLERARVVLVEERTTATAPVRAPLDDEPVPLTFDPRHPTALLPGELGGGAATAPRCPKHPARRP
jgi:hypothetical protein